MALIPALLTERDHYHCPLGCEHPQPFIVGELLLCGRCYFVDDDLTVMVDCTPALCGGRLAYGWDAVDCRAGGDRGIS